MRTSNGMLSADKRLLVKMVVFFNFFLKSDFSNVPSNSLSKVAKIVFPRFFSRVIPNVYTNALLETMLNQHGFMFVFLKIKLANVTPFDRPE